MDNYQSEVLSTSATVIIIFGLALLILSRLTKRKPLSLLIVSFAGNVFSLISLFYGVLIDWMPMWIFYFALTLWPVINMFLIIEYFKKKNLL